MTALIEFQGIGYRAGGHEVLADIDLAIDRGELIVLLGASGAGKTTLLRMTNRLLEPSRGEIRFDGKRLRDWDPIALRRRMGYVIQDGGLFPHLSGARNVALVPELEGWPAQRIAERVDALLERVGLDPARYRERRPRELSGGEKQRVGIARALAIDPPVLLLDEPFAALDPITRFEMQQQFRTLQRAMDKAVLFVTHDLREALSLGTRVALLHAGRIDTLGKPQEFLAARTPQALAFLRTLEERAA